MHLLNIVMMMRRNGAIEVNTFSYNKKAIVQILVGTFMYGVGMLSSQMSSYVLLPRNMLHMLIGDFEFNPRCEIVLL